MSSFMFAQTDKNGSQAWMSEDGTLVFGTELGTQVLGTENLNVDKFRNGDPILQAKTDEEWYKSNWNKQPAWCYYKNNSANGTKYGKLYNWYAVHDPRGLAPNGYHIPTDAEWTQLSDYLNGEEEAGTKMKSTSGWYNNGNGTNSSGFSGLAGGGRSGDGTFSNIDYSGSWWSSAEANTDSAGDCILHYGSGTAARSHYDKKGGLSVRCLRD